MPKDQLNADSDAEREFTRQWAEDFGMAMTTVDVWAKDGDGAMDLANLLLGQHSPRARKPLYDVEDGGEAAIAKITTELYRAGIEVDPSGRLTGLS